MAWVRGNARGREPLSMLGAYATAGEPERMTFSAKTRALSPKRLHRPLTSCSGRERKGGS